MAEYKVRTGTRQRRPNRGRRQRCYIGLSVFILVTNVNKGVIVRKKTKAIIGVHLFLAVLFAWAAMAFITIDTGNICAVTRMAQTLIVLFCAIILSMCIAIAVFIRKGVFV